MKGLGAERLVRHCDPATLGFSTSADLSDLAAVVGQDRAVEAIDFTIAMRPHHYHLFAHGQEGSGRHAIVLAALARDAAARPVADDWCYVYNFGDPRRPKALRVPAGRGSDLRSRMRELIRELTSSLPAAFESDAYRTRRLALEEVLKRDRDAAFEAIERRAAAMDIALARTPMGVGLAIARGGQVLEPEQFEQLPAAEQARLRAAMESLEGDLKALLASIPARERAHRRQVRELNREFAQAAVEQLIDEVRPAFDDLPPVIAHLDAVQADLVDNAEEFVATAMQAEGRPAGAVEAGATGAVHRCEVNLLVDHAGETGAPVLYEDLPTQPNLIGRIEQVARLGALLTNFTLVKGGALHRANGGYLVLDARRVLLQPLAWDELKRALRTRELRFDGLTAALPWLQTATLEPEPIPLDLTVVLIGTWFEAQLLATADPDFPELFKLQADFIDHVDRTFESERLYAELLATIARREQLLPFEADGLAAAIDHAARLAERANWLATTMGKLIDLLREAHAGAAARSADSVGRDDVLGAIERRRRFAGRLAEERRRAVRDGVVHIDVTGTVVGQVNALSVVTLPEITLGWPSRVTAQVRLGRGDVVDIEREVELGGPLHSKGVLILGGFLGGLFGRNRPLALAATIGFEQSYGSVEGDSASLAELCGLLSAIGRIPLRQSLAVTGSVDQLGRVQAVGAVNSKIEGFFEVCADRGLTGSEGVIIPAANVQTLMLRADTVEAVRTGQFTIHAVETVAEALELLTGMPAGDPTPDGRYPPDTAFGMVDAALEALAERAKELSAMTGAVPGEAPTVA
ncbi:MAG: ATP-dependent protease [Chloroflexi bacterium]|nr:ATP-dependent protease [Chloroflexota bacterium]